MEPQVLEERFEDQSVTLRITREANGDLQVLKHFLQQLVFSLEPPGTLVDRRDFIRSEQSSVLSNKG